MEATHGTYTWPAQAGCPRRTPKRSGQLALLHEWRRKNQHVSPAFNVHSSRRQPTCTRTCRGPLPQQFVVTIGADSAAYQIRYFADVLCRQKAGPTKQLRLSVSADDVRVWTPIFAGARPGAYLLGARKTAVEKSQYLRETMPKQQSQPESYAPLYLQRAHQLSPINSYRCVGFFLGRT